MLFNSKEIDFQNTLHFIDSFIAQGNLKSQVCVDNRKLKEVINVLYYDGYYHNGDSVNSSVFKKVAVFILNFIAIHPIQNIDEIKDINAKIAFEIARDSLHGAVIHRDGQDAYLEKSIAISQHSYVELIDAFGKLSIQNGPLLLAVLFEQMSYRANPDCSYPQIC